MVEKSKIKEFPDIGNKLTAPNKKSVFERHKAEAEARRQREEEETAAVYQDFVKSFDDDGAPDNDRNVPGGRGGGFSGPGGGSMAGGFSKRHFSGPSGHLGRGSVRSGPGSLGPPLPSIPRRRDVEAQATSKRESLFAFEDISAPNDPKTVLQHSDDEDEDERRESQERSIPKPTLRLTSLPPGTSSAAIKAVIPPNLSVEGLKILPATGSGSTDRQSTSAIVTLAKDTPALDIDTAVSALQNRYMGRGFYLSLSRHLSSSAATIEPSHGLASSSSSLPFNARPVAPSFARGPSLGPHRGGYAPPSSYKSLQGQFGRGGRQLSVVVTPPSDLKQLKLIHKTIEALLTHGPEFEALLMTRREVQRDESWAWIWNSRSVGGVYYRWRLWDVLSGHSQRGRKSRIVSSGAPQLFENGAVWTAPEQKLPFEYTTEMFEIISDSDYDSSEDDDSGDEGRRRYARYHGGALPPDGTEEAEAQAYLNPMNKAKLTHLLARLPTSNARLRRGDVARVTAFAIQHAGAGADEVVQMIIANVHHPFAFTTANPSFQRSPSESAKVDKLNETSNPEDAHIQATKAEDSATDIMPAKVVALYVISDILSTSSTSGVRHAWRYRSLFESSLKSFETFPHLGRLEKQHNWGRLRAEKWKRSIGAVLSLWESWCVFPGETQEELVKGFNDPPLTPEEERKKKAEEEEERNREAQRSKAATGRWKSVDDNATTTNDHRSDVVFSRLQTADTITAMDVDSVDGHPMPLGLHDGGEVDADLDGQPMSDDESLDGEPMSPSTPSSSHSQPPSPPHLLRQDGTPAAAPVATDSARRTALAASIAAKLGRATGGKVEGGKPGTGAGAGSEIGAERPATGGTGAGRKRQRPKAEDMFADSDDNE